MSAAKYDAVIIGGGHNGLTCGAYLARAGKKVLVLERRSIVGGAAVTEEFAPGFRTSTFSYVMSILHPKIIRELELRELGLTVLLANAVSAWTFMTNELAEIRARMIELGIGIVLEHNLTGFSDGTMQLASIYRGGNARTVDCGSLVVVGIRTSNDDLFQELNSDPDRLADAGISSLRSIGDCRAPGTIAHAVYSGHECARTIDAGDSAPPFQWERPALSSGL